METKPWKHDDTVRAGLERYIEQHHLRHAQIADRLNFSTTRVTKYLNLDDPENVPEADAPKVEQAARNFLRHVARREGLRENLFENSVSADVARCLKQIRKTGDVGLLHSQGGIGKTSGADLYARDNPNTLLVTARQYACGAAALAALLVREYCESTGRTWPGNVRRGFWLEEHLRGSEWLILVDNAQRLQITAFKFLMDLHDATGCAIGMIGNTEVLALLRRHDTEGQLITRIGLVHRVGHGNDAKVTAAALIKQFAPDSCGELLDAAIDLLSRTNARTVKKQLNLAREFVLGGSEATATWTAAWKRANLELIKPSLTSSEVA